MQKEMHQDPQNVYQWITLYTQELVMKRRVVSKETVGYSCNIVNASQFWSQTSSQSFEKVHIYRLKPKSATESEYFEF